MVALCFWTNLGQAAPSLEFSGKDAADIYIPTQGGSQAFEQLSDTFQLQGDLHFSEPSSVRLIYQGILFEGNNTVITGGSPGTHLQSLLREGYYRYSEQGLDFKAGEQITVWGKSDGINPTDFLSGKDFSFFQPDAEDQRLGGLGLSLAYTPFQGTSRFTLTQIWNLNYPQGQLLLAQNILPPGVALASTSPENFSLGNSEYASQIAYNAPDWDISLSYFSGFDHTPQFQLVGISGSTVLISQVYRHLSAFGLNGSKSFEKWVARFEGAYTFTENNDGTQPLILPSFTDDIVGLERVVNHDFHLQGQLIWRFFPNWTSPSQEIAATNALLSQYQDQSSVSYSVRLAYEKEENRLNAEIFFLQNMNGGDFLWRPKLTFAWSDYLKSMVGCDIYGGPPTKSLGAFNPFNSIFIETKYIF